MACLLTYYKCLEGKVVGSDWLYEVHDIDKLENLHCDSLCYPRQALRKYLPLRFVCSED